MFLQRELLVCPAFKFFFLQNSYFKYLVVILYTDILTGNDVLSYFFMSESTFQGKISI